MQTRVKILLALLLIIVLLLVARRYLASETDAGLPTDEAPAGVETVAAVETVAEAQIPSGGELPTTPPEEAPLALESAVETIALAGPAAERDAEYSSLTWFGDQLILMPQYPEYYEPARLFAIDQVDLLAALDGSVSEPITPREVSFEAPDALADLDGYEGFEALVFKGDRAYMSIEAEHDDQLQGFLVSGSTELDADGRLIAVRMDATPVEVPLPANLNNMSLESLLVHGDEILSLFEANGPVVNPAPRMQRFDAALQPLGELSFPSIEYRITDVSDIDPEGRFWAINYFFPGDTELLQPGEDTIAAQWGEGPTHASLDQVERLIELQLSDDAVTLVDRAPVQLQLVDADTARNWEGLVRFGQRGFLVITDKHPETILGFVPMP
jgi:hypothetical protein